MSEIAGAASQTDRRLFSGKSVVWFGANKGLFGWMQLVVSIAAKIAGIKFGESDTQYAPVDAYFPATLIGDARDRIQSSTQPVARVAREHEECRIKQRNRVSLHRPKAIRRKGQPRPRVEQGPLPCVRVRST